MLSKNDFYNLLICVSFVRLIDIFVEKDVLITF